MELPKANRLAPLPEDELSIAADSLEAITRRIAKAAAHPLRVRILAALNEGNLGPAGFVRLNPDVELREAIRHFNRLAELGCIELAGRASGRGREHIYRAVRRALFDASSWTAVPSDRRAGITGQAMSTFMERVAHAARFGSLDARVDRHVTWTALAFDEVGWRRYIDLVDAAFYRSLELNIEAVLRMSLKGGLPIPVTVGLFCFESPRNPDARGQAVDFKDAFVGLRSASAIATPLRVRILVELNKRPMSPTAFYRRFGIGGSPQNIATEFRRLESLGYLEVVDSRRRRGATELVYRAVQRSLFEEDAWRLLPQSLRAEITGVTYTTFFDRVAEAAAALTLDAREDRHFSWSGLHYDEQAWQEMLSMLLDLFQASLEIHEESARRSGGSRPIPVTVGLSCFESPPHAPPTPLDTVRTFLRNRPRDA